MTRFISQLANMYITLPDQLGIYRPKGQALTAAQLATANLSDIVHDISFYLACFCLDRFHLLTTKKSHVKKNK